MNTKSLLAVCRKMRDEGWQVKKIGKEVRLLPPPHWRPPHNNRRFCDCLLTAASRRKYILSNNHDACSQIVAECHANKAAKHLDMDLTEASNIMACADCDVTYHKDSRPRMLLRIRILSAFKLGPDPIPDGLWTNPRDKSVQIQHIKLCNQYHRQCELERKARKKKRDKRTVRLSS